MGLKELLGLDACTGLPTDAKVLFCTKIARALAFGFSSVVLAQYLSLIGLEDGSIGLLMTCTLLGDAAVSLVVTLTADRLGRRFMLQLGAGLKLVGAIIFAAGNRELWLLLLLGATVGVISPSGNEVGPFQTLEQSILSEQTDPHKRTKLFNMYNLVGYLATAVGQMATGIVVDALTSKAGLERVDAYRAVFLAYGLLAVVLAVLSYFYLSPSCECMAWRVVRQEESLLDGAREYQPLLLEQDNDPTALEDTDQPSAWYTTSSCTGGEQRGPSEGLRLTLGYLSNPHWSDDGEQRGLSGGLRPTLGYLSNPHWSDDDGLGGQSLQGTSPESSTGGGVSAAVVEVVSARHRRMQLVLSQQLSLHSPSSPRKILRATLSEESSSSSSGASSASGSVAGMEGVWAAASQAQLAALQQQRQQLEHCRLPLSSALGTTTTTATTTTTTNNNNKYSRSHTQAGKQLQMPDCRAHALHRYPVDLLNSSRGSSNPSLSPPPGHPSPTPGRSLMSGKSLRLVLGLSVLLMVDAMGAGMIPGAFVVHYLHSTFAFSQALLGSLLSISSTVAGFAGLLAGWLSDRMGLVRTMVLTHLPSSCMLLLVPFTPPAAAMSLIVARSCLGRMDVGPRQSYISGIVPAHERTAALGITNILRSLGAAMGPVVTGRMASAGLWPQVFCLSGGLMIAYNVALLIFFNAIRADHEMEIIPLQQQQQQQQQQLRCKIPRPQAAALNDLQVPSACCTGPQSVTVV